jgi:hypothetical protein
MRLLYQIFDFDAMRRGEVSQFCKKKEGGGRKKEAKHGGQAVWSGGDCLLRGGRRFSGRSL